jgi:ribokinase
LTSPPRITVVGSVNLDLVASGAPLPAPGQTVTGAQFARHPGGKGANQALAARRLGAEVALVARVGDDALADEALALLARDHVDLTAIVRDPHASTGVALITVAPDGENCIVVAPGANARFAATDVRIGVHDAVICQLEVPDEALVSAATQCTGLFCLNLAPARAVADAALQRADLIVVNESEAESYGPSLHTLPGAVVQTRGAAGASLSRAGAQIAAAASPAVTAVDTTAAGDAFVGALVVALLERRSPASALQFACAAGAAAATIAGAQPSLPTRAQVLALLEQALQ